MSQHFVIHFDSPVVQKGEYLTSLGCTKESRLVAINMNQQRPIEELFSKINNLLNSRGITNFNYCMHYDCIYEGRHFPITFSTDEELRLLVIKYAGGKKVFDVWVDFIKPETDPLRWEQDLQGQDEPDYSAGDPEEEVVDVGTQTEDLNAMENWFGYDSN